MNRLESYSAAVINIVVDRLYRPDYLETRRLCKILPKWKSPKQQP